MNPRRFSAGRVNRSARCRVAAWCDRIVVQQHTQLERFTSAIAPNLYWTLDKYVQSPKQAGIKDLTAHRLRHTYATINFYLIYFKNPGSMKRNSSGRNQANSDVHQQLHKLPYLEYPDLLTATNIVGGKTTCLIKGAITARLSLARLRDEIRYCVDRGTFPDRIERLTHFLEGCTPTTTEQVVNEKNPKVVVRELIDTIQAIACELPDRVLFDLVLSLIENPEGVFDGDYNTFDSAAEKLGFSYEETDEDYTSRIVPSPQLLKQIVTQMTRGEFYHSFIYLAGLGLDRNQFSPPPSQFLAGYEFLEQLAEFLSSLSVQQPWNGSHIHHKALDSANRF